MVSYLKRLIRWAKVVKAGADSGVYPVQQVTYLGKTGDAVMLFPYGMHANVDEGLSIVLAVGGDAENRAAIPTSMSRRSQLEAGDVEIYSPVSRSRITIRANSDIEAVGKNITATADESVTVKAPTITLDGDAVVTGGLTVDGTMTNAGKDVGATHGHAQGPDSSGDSQAPIVGVT